MVKILCGDSADLLSGIDEGSISLIYIDPPFNTGKDVVHRRVKAMRVDKGEGTPGFQGNHYVRKEISKKYYADEKSDYIGFIMDRVKLAYPLLTANGSFFLHADYREIHYLKVEMDKLFGRENFINEIIWAYDYGARSRKRWSTKHDTILWYAKDKDNYIYNYDAIDRIDYLAPSLVGKDKADRGKTPTDVWWNTIVGTNSKERHSAGGYPTQKPLTVLERIVLVHSDEGDKVLDFFAGSGTTGVAAAKHGREAILVDESREAVKVMKNRFASCGIKYV